MCEVVHKGYRIRVQRAKQWFGRVYPPGATIPWDRVFTAPIDKGQDALLAAARAHIEEDIIDMGGVFMDG